MSRDRFGQFETRNTRPPSAIVALIESRYRRYSERGGHDVARQRFPLRIRHFSSHAIIVHEGSPVSHVAFLSKGTVALSILGQSGNRRVFMLLSAEADQDAIIDPASLECANHSLTCEALTDVDVYVVDRPAFSALAETDATLSYAMSRMLSAFSGRLVAEFHSQLVLPARERLAGVLLQLAALHGRTQNQRTRITLPLSRQDLASIVGVSKETLIRMLQALKNDGLIDLIGLEIDIVSRAKLQTLADRTRLRLNLPMMSSA
ncbi:MAG: Crp/Fnr family transcriptional regulator [Nitrospirae bacterium]|nr:MAG: Crp/Fnr family transcriptional regulator [Nitrospirota bacterium]